jgi:hypothetical protein
LIDAKLQSLRQSPEPQHIEEDAGRGNPFYLATTGATITVTP